MSSNYSTDLRIELITTGEQAGVWGITTNNNLQNVIEQAIAGYVSVSVTSTNYVLTYKDGGSTNGALNQAGYASIALVAAVASNYNIYVPPAPKLYVFYNAGGYTATVYVSNALGSTTAAGTGVIIPSGQISAVWSDGANMRYQTNSLAALNLVGADSTGYLSAPRNGVYLSSDNNLCISTNSTKAITFDSSQNADMGTGLLTNADRYLQLVNASTGTSASASLYAKSTAQTIQLTAYGSLHSSVGGVSVNSKSALRVSGGAGGLYIWDASTSPTITFLVGATATTAGTVDASGNWSFNSKTLSSATWNGAAVGAAYGGTGVANNAANTITFTGNYSLGLTLTGNTSVTLPTSGTLATTTGFTYSLSAPNTSGFAPFFDSGNILAGYDIRGNSTYSSTTSIRFIEADTGTASAVLSGTLNGFFNFGNSSGSAASSTINVGKLQLNVTTGTAPLTVSSTTRVDNLNVQYLSGKQNTDFLQLTSGGQVVASGSSVVTSPTSGTSAGVDGGWIAYTPVVYTLSGSTYTTVTTGTRKGRYLIVGNQVFVNLYVNFLANGTNDTIIVTLPTTCASLPSGWSAGTFYGASGALNCTSELGSGNKAGPNPQVGTNYCAFTVSATGYPAFMTMPTSPSTTPNIYGSFSYAIS